MRIFATILAVLTLQGPALAQQIQPPRGPLATQGSSAHLDGITVNGSATKRVPATTAHITLQFVGRNGAMTLNATTVQPIIEALVKSGIPRESIVTPVSLGSPASLNNATLSFVVTNPTVAQMQSGVATVGATLATDAAVTLSGAQVTLEADTCANDLDAIRAQAIKNARARAESVARDLGVRVGTVLNVVANDYAGATGICTTQYYLGPGFSNGPTSANDYVSVPVVANVQITYAIRP